MLDKVLVANRGEIAVRVLRTCQRLGIPTVAIFSDADVTAMHVAEADEAVRVGPPPVRESYLSIAAIVDAARATGATAVHPGYGLLSESAEFARALSEAGVRFVGPSPAALEAFGDKIRARAVARAAGVSPPPGTEALPIGDVATLTSSAAALGYPLLVKAAGGGGGIGMQLVQEPQDLERAARTCSDRGRAAFGDDRVYLERWVANPRHVEVQILRDSHGGAVSLGERECSVQRRHQKIVEETPSPASFFRGAEGAERRSRLHAAALAVVERVGYEGAGTVEFVVDAGGEPYFLEVNARLQVEHPVTEMVTGLDLVEAQLRIAAGEPLGEELRTTTPTGAAIEVRLYAEDPSKGFIPQPGRIERLEWPTGEGIRVDAGVRAGDEVTPYYDPMIAKIIAHAPTRSDAVRRLAAALAVTHVSLAGPRGPKATNLELLRALLDVEAFRSGDYDTSLAEALVKKG